MKKFRNTLLILMALVMILSAFACKKTDDHGDANGSSSGNANENTEANESTNEENNDETPEAIDREKENEDDGISDLYKLVEKDLAKEVKEDNKAFMIPLGAGYDEETLKAVLTRLKEVKEKYSYEKDLEELMMLVKSDDGNTYLVAQEFYLLVPKYDDADISLKELELSEEGELEAVPNEALDGKIVHGPTLIVQNISDIAPNGEITIKDKAGEVKFAPYVSLKDGELMLDEGAVDASEVLSYDDKADDYDEKLFEKIYSYMPKF